MFPVECTGGFVFWLGRRICNSMVGVRFPTAAGMGDRLWADKPPQYFTKPARPTQPLTLSRTGNEYQPKWSDVLWPGSEGRLIPPRM